MSRDPQVVEDIKADKLLHDTGTYEGLAGMLDRTAALNEGKVKLNQGVRSLWLGHGTADEGTSYPASKKWFERQTDLEDKTSRATRGGLTCYMPICLRIAPSFAKDVGDWILARVGPEDVKAKL
jgi:acylglycerol lipase